MRSLAEIERRLEAIVGGGAATDADELLRSGEEVLEHWIAAKGAPATQARSEGFRLLALHRQGATGDASFNACRETCRELVYHYNLVTSGDGAPRDRTVDLRMMALVANHLCLFVSGKMQVAELGEFCCSSKPLHGTPDELAETQNA